MKYFTYKISNMTFEKMITFYHCKGKFMLRYKAYKRNFILNRRGKYVIF